MQLLNITDPRDNLEKAHRLELVKFANENGLREISEHMPAILIRKKLRAAGIVNIRLPERTLGQIAPSVSFGGEAITDRSVNEINADDDLERQFNASKPDYKAMKMNELRSECKRLGIKMDLRDNLESLRNKLEQNAS